MGRYYETFYPPFFMDLSYRHDAIAQNRTGFNRRDDAIVDDLRKAIVRLLPGEAQSITVSSINQIVTLTGIVSTCAVAAFLTKLADRILGVRIVENNLEIKRAGAEARPKELDTPRNVSHLVPHETLSEL